MVIFALAYPAPIGYNMVTKVTNGCFYCHHFDMNLFLKGV